MGLDGVSSLSQPSAMDKNSAASLTICSRGVPASHPPMMMCCDLEPPVHWDASVLTIAVPPTSNFSNLQTPSSMRLTRWSVSSSVCLFNAQAPDAADDGRHKL